MKIFYTSPSIDPTIEKRHFLQLALNLKALRNDLLLLVPRYGRDKNENYEFDTVFIPTGGRQTFRSYLLVEFLRFFYLPFLLLRFRPDVIYNRKEKFDFGPPFWACLFQVPYVVEVNTILEKELKISGYPEWMIKVFKIVEFFNYKVASRIICVTEGIKNWLLKSFKLKEKQMRVVSNGVDTKLFRPLDKKECRQKLGLEGNLFYVGFSGSFAPWQDLETLVKAAKLVKATGYPIRYLLMGSGARESELRHLVDQNQLEKDVFFAGWVEYEKVPLYIGSFDICYVSRIGPSLCGSPLKLYEYFACGKPVIASRVEGIKENIEESKNGFLFEPNNAEELADVIVRCFLHRDSLEHLGLAGRELIESKYSWRDIAQKIIMVFHEIV